MSKRWHNKIKPVLAISLFTLVKIIIEISCTIYYFDLNAVLAKISMFLESCKRCQIVLTV